MFLLKLVSFSFLLSWEGLVEFFVAWSDYRDAILKPARDIIGILTRISRNFAHFSKNWKRNDLILRNFRKILQDSIRKSFRTKYYSKTENCFQNTRVANRSEGYGNAGQGSYRETGMP